MDASKKLEVINRITAMKQRVAVVTNNLHRSGTVLSAAEKSLLNADLMSVSNDLAELAIELKYIIN